MANVKTVVIHITPSPNTKLWSISITSWQNPLSLHILNLDQCWQSLSKITYSYSPIFILGTYAMGTPTDSEPFYNRKETWESGTLWYLLEGYTTPLFPPIFDALLLHDDICCFGNQKKHMSLNRFRNSSTTGPLLWWIKLLLCWIIHIRKPMNSSVWVACCCLGQGEGLRIIFSAQVKNQ